ncbi:MAG: thiamine pyrophosphate-dependent enzyme [Phycisphaerae bacterium]
MRFNRAQVIDENFIAFLRNPDSRSARPFRDRAIESVESDDLLEMFESQMVTRHLDLIARELRARDIGFYTIASAGHEGNAAVGRITRHTDPAFLHYRSGAFMAERARKIPGIDIIYDTLLSQMAASDDPAAGGRHKVWGSKPLWVLPQTSTIASHLPKAVGTALAIVRARRLGIDLPIPDDSIAVCSFGDASCNHSTAAGAFNAARWGSYQSVPMPVLFVCEDNGYGISVRTPDGWIESNFRDQPGLTYFQADGLDLVDTFTTATKAVDTCRSRRSPVFLHLRLVRMLGHAGSDMEAAYRSFDEIEATEARDPLLRSAHTILDLELMDAGSILELYEAIRERTRAAADRAAGRPRLSSAAEVMRPLAPYSPDRVRTEAARDDYHDRRLEAFESEARLPENAQPRHLAVHINHALFDLMAKYREAVVFGEDVAAKGGVYHVTAGLARRFKFGRVFNTPLDEQTILGLAQGAGYAGLLPIPEIQYLAYFHNACDQIRGEACSQQFFSDDQFRNPMIVRVASLAYQKGFGGHFHNDNSIAALRDIPGLIIACPSRGDDAAAMLRTAAALAKIDGRVIVFLEPIALYMTKDLYEKGDGQWLFPYPPPNVAAPFGEPRVYSPEAGDLAIITYGNGVYFSLRVAERLRGENGVRARVVDLRWLNPLNHEAIARHADDYGKVLVVDEGRRTGGLGEAIITSIIEHCETRPVLRRVVGEDSYIPLGPAADHVLPSEDRILNAARKLIQSR